MEQQVHFLCDSLTNKLLELKRNSLAVRAGAFKHGGDRKEQWDVGRTLVFVPERLCVLLSICQTLDIAS